MLSKNTISIFCNLLKNLAEKEKQVEINRQVLCQNLNFDAYQVFSYLDLESKNYLNEINLITFLQKKNQIPCNLEELQFLILIYDENFDAKLSYSEFLNFVLSDNDFELRKKTRERICSRYDNNTIDFNVEYSLVKLFQKELDLIRTTRRLIEELKACEDFNVHDLFHYLKGYGNITNESMNLFLEKNGILFDNNDLINIMKRLDINNDSKIDFDDFHQFLCFPKLKCNCCSFCQCNCLISNKNIYSNKDESSDEHYNYNYSDLIKKSNNQRLKRNENITYNYINSNITKFNF
jgi:Ca2+-binding EF-hand superfamily protein